ncbi:death domain-associated protein [Halolamina sp. CBA1230]|uniref:DUF5786 family protein n=1 Tax=Halolamina sp. CBA1230 TaxID=1853690 RepID=UPI0009A1654A|nr:DUF5786 family protein [Halolamina sp. CBA1230]QKY19443.1 death domain-associated protein [Halolamina sp. CBA1230]
MGFGSYDESEQENKNQDTDEQAEGVDVDGGEEGDLSFESTESTDELVGKLDEMRDDEDDDE